MGNGSALRNHLASGACVIAPDVHDVMSAQLAEELGFEAIYVGSFGSAATRWGLPDQSLLTMSQILDHLRIVADTVSLPIIADFEDGGGNAVTCFRNVEAAVRAGVAAVQIEDQVPGKGYGPVGDLYPTEIAATKIRAAVEARGDDDLVVVARTEALAIGRSIEEATERCAAYVEAGADMITPTGVPPESLTEFSGAAGAPVATWAVGTHSPAELGAAGYAIAIYPMQTTLISYLAIRSFLEGLRDEGVGMEVADLQAAIPELMATNHGVDNTRLATRFGVID